MTRSLPLRLKELFFPEISVKALVSKSKRISAPEFDMKDLEISFAFDKSADGKRVNAALKIVSKKADGSKSEAAALYEISVEVFARFDVIMPEHDDAKATFVRRVSAASALVGAAREQISMVTARAPWGTAWIPMISMDLVVGPPPSENDTKTTPAVPATQTRRRLRKPTPEDT